MGRSGREGLYARLRIALLTVRLLEVFAGFQRWKREVACKKIAIPKAVEFNMELIPKPTNQVYILCPDAHIAARSRLRSVERK